MAASVLANRVKFSTATTGTGTLTVGAAASNAFCTPAEAGVSNGDVVSYCIEDGTDFEVGQGTYSSTGPTLSRDTVLLSKISATAGTDKIDLSGAATVFLTAVSEDFSTMVESDATAALEAGYTAASDDQGTKSSGTFTPAFADRNIQHCVNNGAFTLGVPTGHGSLVLDITNDASAGAITTSGFTLVTGDDFTTTDDDAFRCYITCGNAGSHLHVVAFQ